MAVEKRKSYHGSLWIRGRAPDGIAVRLLDGDKKLTEKILPAPAPYWQEMDFKFRSPSTVNNAAIQIAVKGKGAVYLDQVSLMPQASLENDGFRPDLLEAVKELKPPIIRWPGGAFAEFYRWKDAIGPQHKRKIYPLEFWEDQDINSLGTDEFITLCRRVSAEPMLVVNIGFNEIPQKRPDYIQEACDWIEYCNAPANSKWGKVRAANGHPEPYNVKYWEIGNEAWWMGASDYSKVANDFASAMKKIDPEIRIAFCGSADLSYDSEFNGMPWNRVILDKCADKMDYLSIHHYEQPDNFAKGPFQMEDFIKETAKLIASSSNPDITIYCSEWNAMTTDWRTGLYAGGVLNAFERCSDIFEIGGPALFLRHVSASDWDNAFINFDHYRWFGGCNYIVMKLWRNHYAPNRIEMSGDTDILNAIATKSSDGKKLYIKAVNPTDISIGVMLSVQDGFKVADADMQLVAPDSLNANNSLDNPNAVRIERAKVEVSGQSITFGMPRWSAGVVNIKGN